MSRFPQVIVYLAIGIFPGLPGQSRPAASDVALAACRPADTVTVPERVTYLQNLISSVDPVYGAPRDSLGLARQRASSVSLVTKTTTCQRGVDALNALLQAPGTVRRIWMFAVGSGYAIQDPDLPSSPGQADPLFFFDSQFHYLGTLMVE